MWELADGLEQRRRKEKIKGNRRLECELRCQNLGAKRPQFALWVWNRHGRWRWSCDCWCHRTCPWRDSRESSLWEASEWITRALLVSTIFLHQALYFNRDLELPWVSLVCYFFPCQSFCLVYQCGKLIESLKMSISMFLPFFLCLLTFICMLIYHNLISLEIHFF